jgi:putative FmdB family regulatory protein
MPTYVYECTKCQKRFELEQRITAPPRKRCPFCRGKVFRVITGGGGVILKGNGFYVTDYRSEEYKKEKGAEKQAPAPKPLESPSSGHDQEKIASG